MKFIYSTMEREATPLAFAAPPAIFRQCIHRDVRLWPQSAKLAFFLFLCAASAFANVCTPLSVPAQGPFPAIPANGVDGISWSVARVQWTSDATSSVPATKQQIVYATAAEWAANPGVYPHITAQTTQLASSSSANQGGILSNLLPATVYHFEGQSFQGGAWCTATDATFTTLARPATQIVKPQLPISVDTTRPAMNGTHWVYGSNCGTTSGSSAATVTANLQNCLDSMRATTGDDLALPPGTYPITQINLHNSELSANVTCSTSSSTCALASGSAPANGTQIVVGSQIFGSVPSPVNPGIPYKVINSSGSSFQISYDGVTPITLLNAGSLVSYIPYPLTQPKMVVHSTAAANLLPPPGVRLGPDALAQYLPNMPNLQAVDPIYGATGRSYVQYAPLTMNLTWENVAFSVDPTVATTQSANPTDPQGWLAPVQLGITNQGITFDQVAFLHPGAPSRIAELSFNGVNNALVNSYSALDWWQPHYYVPSQTSMSVSANTISIPAATWSYVGPAGTKVSCNVPAGTITIGGSGSGNLFLWTNKDCTQGGSLTNGLTASTTIAGLTITNAATPAYPTYTFTSAVGYTVNNYACIPSGYPFTIVNGAITDTNAAISGNWVDIGHDLQRAEGSTGIEIAAWGPLKFDNNYIQGSGIGGVFWADDLTLGSTPCGTANPCPVQAVLGNLTVTRNTMTTDPVHFFYDSPNWDGGNRFWRNLNEQKAGRYALFDGNILGPWSAQVGEGQCGLHEAFENQFISIGKWPAYVDSSDWTFTNNTCLNMPSTQIATAYSFQGYINYGYPMKNALIQNDLFLNNNAYAQVAKNQPFRSDGHVVADPANAACPQGQMTNLAQGENFVFDHLTVWGMGGCQPFFLWYNADLSSSGITNSILNLVNDPGPFASYTPSGTLFLNNGYYTGSCVAQIGANLFNCIHNFSWGGNVMLATWTNSYPGSQVEFTPSQISSAQSYYTGYPASWPNASTLAGRAAQIGWFSTSAANFRLAANSPYISGAKSSIDGLDVGVNMDQLEQHQGKVSNVRVMAKTSTSATLGFYGPDSFACGVDWGTAPFYNGSGTWTRVAGASGPVDPRVQSVTLSSLPAHALIYYRLNCAVMQPSGTIQLP